MKTLHGRLILALLALIIPLSALFIYIALTTAQQYYQEITQKLNADLAQRILLSKPDLMLENKVNEAEFDSVAQMLVTTNPGVEVYIVDNQGMILGSSVSMESLQRKQVSLEAIKAYLSPQMNFPIRGSDPQHSSEQKIFSVAKLDKDFGYLYVILADESRDSVIRTVQNSTVLKVAMWIMAVALLLVFLFGLWMFRYLTRRLRRLTINMNAFKQSDFVIAQPLLRQEANDEIDQLSNVFSEMTEKISEQVQGLRQVDALRRELITNVSHDLRTPLAALQGYLETLQLKASSLSEEQKQHYLAAAGKHSERLGKLIKDLFDLSRFDADAVEVNLENFLLQELVQDIVAKFEGLASERNIALKITADTNLPFVRADIGLVERVLTNLLENALKFTASGQVKVKLYKTQHIEFSVEDSGIGVPEASLGYIFERFYQADVKHRQSGSGLGLALAQSIVQWHGGIIEAQNCSLGGAMFRVKLPLNE